MFNWIPGSGTFIWVCVTELLLNYLGNDNLGGSTNTRTAAAIAVGVILFILILTLLLLGAILFNTVRKKCEQPQQCGDKSTSKFSVIITSYSSLTANHF